MTAAKVSIITPCYNQGALLRQAVQSVLAQTHPEWEMIIIDDGSTDDTGEVAEALTAAHPGRIRLIRQPNQGQAQARQNAFETATGEFIVLLDSDDLLEPGMLAAGLAAFERDPEAAAVIGLALLVEPDGATVIRTIEQARVVGWPRIAHGNPYGALVGGMLRREAIAQVGGLGFAGVAGCEDWDLWMRMTRARLHFTVTDTLFGRYRRSADSYSMNPLKMLQSALAVLQAAAQPDPRLAAIADPHPPIPESLHIALHNRIVLHNLGKAMAVSDARPNIAEILAELRPGTPMDRHDHDAFVTGIHFANLHGGCHTMRPAMLEERMTLVRDEFAKKQLPARFAGTIQSVMQNPRPKRHLLTRLAARLRRLAGQ